MSIEQRGGTPAKPRPAGFLSFLERPTPDSPFPPIGRALARGFTLRLVRIHFARSTPVNITQWQPFRDMDEMINRMVPALTRWRGETNGEESVWAPTA